MSNYNFATQFCTRHQKYLRKSLENFLFLYFVQIKKIYKYNHYKLTIMITKKNIFVLMQLHHEKECPAYPVVCEKCNKDGIPRAKVGGQEITGLVS